MGWNMKYGKWLFGNYFAVTILKTISYATNTLAEKNRTTSSDLFIDLNFGSKWVSFIFGRRNNL